MGEKFPLHHNLHLKSSKPFIGYMPSGKAVIVVREEILNAHGDIIYTANQVIDTNPSKETRFKINLSNPQEHLTTVKPSTESADPDHPKDN